MERNNKYIHLFIRHSFLKGCDAQGGCRMTKDWKATAVHPCSPLMAGAGRDSGPSLLALAGQPCVMFWLRCLPAVTLDGCQSGSVPWCPYGGDTNY